MDDFNNKTYVKRRKEISKLMESNSCFLINSANLKFRNNDSSYFFRQDSNFYYLSGFVEPDSLIMIENNGKSTLFCRERNLELEKWDGFMHGVDGAKKTFGFDECFDITEKENLIPEMIKGKTNLYCLIGKDKNFDASVSSWVNKANNLERHQANIDIKNFSNELGMMRLIKDEHELSLMRKSCEITPGTGAQLDNTMEFQHGGGKCTMAKYCGIRPGTGAQLEKYSECLARKGANI